MEKAVLTVENASVSFGNRRLLSRVNFCLSDGEQIVLRGPNGSGKTTLLKALLGLIPLSQGSIYLNACLVGSASWKRERSKMAWLPQQGIHHRFAFTVLEIVEMGLAGKKLGFQERRRRLDEALVSMDLSALAAKNFHCLSGGEQQRVSFARCWVQDSPILLLDEPTKGFDSKNLGQFERLIHDLVLRGTSLILVTHRPSLSLPGSWRELFLDEGCLC